jgi:hypothetical protein
MMGSPGYERGLVEAAVGYWLTECYRIGAITYTRPPVDELDGSAQPDLQVQRLQHGMRQHVDTWAPARIRIDQLREPGIEARRQVITDLDDRPPDLKVVVEQPFRCRGILRFGRTGGDERQLEPRLQLIQPGPCLNRRGPSLSCHLPMAGGDIIRRYLYGIAVLIGHGFRPMPIPVTEDLVCWRKWLMSGPGSGSGRSASAFGNAS